MRFLLSTAIVIISLLPQVADAQEVHQDLQGVWSAEVVEILQEEERVIPGTQTETTVQEISARILDGSSKGEIVVFENDFTPLREGQKFFISYIQTIDGNALYAVQDIDRRGVLVFLTVLFMLIVILFGKWQGVRSIFSLLGSFLVIIFVLLPLLLQGYNPVVVSAVIGALILGVAIFFTHGFNWNALVAFIGTTITVILTGLLAFMSIELLELTGFFSSETVYLNFGTQGNLDFKGLLLGGIIIGVLGVLDDIAITQVAMVAELKRNAPDITKYQLFESAMRVGREHVSALVNTLVLAYAGVSLPLLLWFSRSEASFGAIVNNEVFATEIARTLVGSVGLILAVPITTYAAVLAVSKLKQQEHGHTHHH